MDLLERHYTEANFSKLLVSHIACADPTIILDLGIGGGALTQAAYQRWKMATFLGIDVDSSQLAIIREELPFVNLYNLSGLNVHKKFPFKYRSVDIAICNPPYFKLKFKETYQSLFKSARLAQFNTLQSITSEIVFLVQNLVLLKVGGQLGIILPDGLITSHGFKVFRSALIENYCIKTIIELPANIFKKTEAKTHILIIENKKYSFPYKVEVMKADVHGKCTEPLKIYGFDLCNRMDYTYLKWKNDTLCASKKLRDYDVEIIRGRSSSKILKETTTNFLHTTNYKNGDKLYLGKSELHDTQKRVARKGDIIVSRVGRRCIGKIAIVMDGNAFISDCLYIIRADENVREIIFNAFISSNGQIWFNTLAHGVCSQVISKVDLWDFPIL